MKSNHKSTPEQRFERLFKRGTEILHGGNAIKAAKILERAHKIDELHLDVAINLSGAYILSKKYKKAVAVLEPFREFEPDHVMLWTNLGAAYLGNPILALEKEQVKAIAAFERAIELNPIAPNVAYNLGLIYRDRGDFEVAISWFERAVQANPNDKDAQALIERLRQIAEENMEEQGNE